LRKTSIDTKPRLILLYHYFHPDDVISARLYSDLAEEMTARGWDVTAMPANRSCHQDTEPLPKSESWNQVSIRRVYRPNFRQASNKGRILNMIFMLWAWSWRAIVTPRSRHESVIIGTDPTLAILVAIAWRIFRPRSTLVHWCHDVYPEAAVAEGMLRDNGLITRMLRWLLRRAYRRCDKIIDLGSCMRELLARYGSKAQQYTVTPWSLVEPKSVAVADAATRSDLFGDAKIGLLYSGNLGRAHQFEDFVALAREVKEDSIHFCFAGRGPRLSELEQLVQPSDTNIGFRGFAPEEVLEKRLGACDFHLVSLRPEWTGAVVPSKFFGALASGRGVIFSGSEQSAIAQWIVKYQLGWVLTRENAPEVAADLRRIAKRPEELAALRERCFRVYQDVFSREKQIRAMATAIQ
jgi:glycosyltransferase involved in cell wall biosynthesis